MELPRALWPWRQSLSIFPADLAIALGGIVDKLALLVGPLVSPDTSGRDQPDGIDGVGRRGSFERLLTTEWALADEAPLEFLRRVSTGELSFLEIAHQKPTVARQCVVLFDVGPDQHGGPRIVHLAALILLEQRARSAGARFSWGILQDPNRELIGDVNEESVRILLKPGSGRRMAIDDAIGFYQTRDDDEAEIWFVGGAHTSEATANIGAIRLQIEDSFDPDAPFDLHVTVFGKQGKPRTARLELPPSKAAVRLLRDPFQVARAIPQKSKVRLAPETNIVFSRCDRKLFCLGAEGELVTIPIPNSPNCTTLPKPRIFRPPSGERIMGVGRLVNSRTIVVATSRNELSFIHYLSPRLGASLRHRRYGWEIDSSPTVASYVPAWFFDDHVPTRLGEIYQSEKDRSLLLYDGGRALFKFDEERVSNWDGPVTALQHTSEGLSWLRYGESSTWMTFQNGIRNGIDLPKGTTDVRYGQGNYLAARTSPVRWQVIDPKGHEVYRCEIPTEYEVIGVANLKTFVFFVLDQARLCMFTRDGNETVQQFSLSSPVKTIHTTAGCWLIAFITEDNELCIFSREFNTFILRMRLGEP